MVKSARKYLEQDRGKSENYEKYLSGMDAVIVEKIASASAYFPHKDGYSIIDVGTASGTGSYILALLFPKCKVIGVDINPKMIDFARNKYQLPNLEFIVDDGEKLQQLQNERIAGFFNCSSIHHITSFNNYNPHKAYLTIKRQAELLEETGVLVIRDFNKAEPEDVIIEFPATKTGKADVELIKTFSATARSLSPQAEKGFPLRQISESKFQVNMVDIYEFIRRKDYLNDWDVELQEEYGYYSQPEFEQLFSELGLRTIVSAPIYNPWIIQNRYKDKFRLFSMDGRALNYPPTNYIIAGEKVGDRGTELRPVRNLPVMDDSFIKLTAYQNSKSKEIFDLAHRPFPVIDILPYIINENKSIQILAKHGYPRPIITQLGKRNNIDGKKYSGYITESITAMRDDTPDDDLIAKTLCQRAKVESDRILKSRKALTYYPSPGGIDEKVDSFFVEIRPLESFEKKGTKAFGSKFEDSGEIRLYDTLQLLNAIQVGAIPDVRLEVSIYNLLLHLGINKGKWLNDRVEIKEVNQLESKTLDELFKDEHQQEFIHTEGSANFLSHVRTKFYEYPKESSTSIFEYILPEKLSVNTLVALPVYEWKGEVFVGIEKRYLPVPQIQEGGSLIPTVPAFRLPKNISTKNDLELYIASLTIEGASIKSFTKLGEKYFPCTGLTPEQVYPYAVSLSNPAKSLYWISLNELFNSLPRLRDGHLIAALFRLTHALSG